jgi:hypothetical protein
MSGHGWVVPNEDGSLARCGGPGICKTCQEEMKEKLTEYVASRPTPPAVTNSLIALWKERTQEAQARVSQLERRNALMGKVISAVRAWRELGDEAPDLVGVQKTLEIFIAMDALDADDAQGEKS